MKMLVCPKCLKALESRGEKPIILDRVYVDPDNEESPTQCEWCNEESDELYDIKF